MRRIMEWIGGRGIAAAVLAGMAMGVAAQDAAPLPQERKVALKTSGGYYLTAENGGGFSVNTDRTELGPWETFTMIAVSPGVFAFRTENGNYLCDLGAESRGRRAARTSLAASKRQMDSSTHFKVILLDPEGPQVALVTAPGKYVTAENSGGVNARGARAVSTDREEIGSWERLHLVDVEKLQKQ